MCCGQIVDQKVSAVTACHRNIQIYMPRLVCLVAKQLECQLYQHVPYPFPIPSSKIITLVLRLKPSCIILSTDRNDKRTMVFVGTAKAAAAGYYNI